MAGPVAATVAAGGGASAHVGHGRDADGAVDGAAGHMCPPERRGPRACGRHLPGRPAVQGERAERERNREHGGQDVAPHRLSGPVTGRVLLGHRLVQRLLNRAANCRKSLHVVHNNDNNNYNANNVIGLRYLKLYTPQPGDRRARNSHSLSFLISENKKMMLMTHLTWVTAQVGVLKKIKFR